MATDTANSVRNSRPGDSPYRSDARAGNTPAHVDATGATFGKMLSAQQQLLTGTLHDDEKTSANLMFEPAESEKGMSAQTSKADNLQESRDERVRPEPKSKRLERTSQTHDATDPSSVYSNIRGELNDAGLRFEVRNSESGSARERSSADATGNGSANSISNRVDDAESSQSSAPGASISSEESNVNHQTESAAPINSSTSRDANNAFESSPMDGRRNVSAVGETENDASPARQIGRLLASSNSGDLPSSERADALPQTRNSKSAPTPESTQSSAARSTSSNSGAKTSASEVTQPTPFEQLVQSLRLRVGSKVSSAVMQLHPPQLGRMKIDVRAIGDQIKVSVETESHAARDRVSERASELRAALAQHGIDVRQFDVTVGTPIAHSESYFAQGWGRSSDAERHESGNYMDRKSTGSTMTDFVESPFVSGFTAVGTTRLDVKI